MIHVSFDAEGNVQSLRSGAVEFAAPECDLQGLFLVQFRDLAGNPVTLSRQDFNTCSVSGNNGKWEIVYTDCSAVRGSSVTVAAEEKADGLHWNICVTPGSPFIKTEWVDFPRLRFAKRAAENWLLPFAEGTLVSDLADRQQNAHFKCGYSEYPMTGVSNFYPGPAAMQFEACYNNDSGICILCADPAHTPKTIDAGPAGDDACRLLLQHFTGGENTLAYDVVFAGFQGDWQDAAAIYRAWMEENDPCLPAKQFATMPQWLKASPTFLIYAVKGHGLDLGDLHPNEYYPYVNALPVVERYRKLWGGTFATVLMHWEGTAPWAPPYVWPPFGGEAELKKFVDAMHAQGDRVGLYSSGIGWTQQSMTDMTYNLEEKFRCDNITAEVCQGPRQEKYSRVCNGLKGQRIGYDLCPGREFTRDVTCSEISKAAALGVDYLQYFDQNQGCAAPLCYAKDHGHDELPGAWETAAMRNLLHEAVRSGNGMVIGCENAAAQPYVDSCKLNDLRYHIAWGAGGIPVPVYPYLFHEYTAGFSGNGVCLSLWVDVEKTPDFLLWQLAWNFAYGNFLSLVLKDGGNVHWNWALEWSKPQPEQEPICALMKNLTGWRRKLSENYLAAGRMLKIPEVLCEKRTFYRQLHAPVELPKVIASAWQGIDGKKITLLVNYNGEEVTCTVAGKTITLPAYDAAVIE